MCVGGILVGSGGAGGANTGVRATSSNCVTTDGVNPSSTRNSASRGFQRRGNGCWRSFVPCPSRASSD